MKDFTILLFVLLFLGNYPEGRTEPVSKIKIMDGKFYNSKGDLFFSWGFNYTNPEHVGLIEEHWNDETVWKTIVDDLREMKELGANTVRIHLQYHRFMKDPNTPDRQALNKLEQLVKMAEKHKLYLLITGLAAYRKRDQPDWYNSMNDRERRDTQKIFWKSIAQRVGKYNSVFAYDLMNEPVVSVGCKKINECDWTEGSNFGGFYFVQDISRNPENKFHDTILRWSGELRQAIRSVDEKTLITIGFLNLGDITPFAKTLNFISAHIYPKTEKIDALHKTAIDFFIENNPNVNKR